MPWEIFEHNGQHCLRNQQTGKLVAGSCHDNRDDTLAMMRALYANMTAEKALGIENNDLPQQFIDNVLESVVVRRMTEGKSMDDSTSEATDFLIGNWSEIKALPDGSIGGYLVRYGSPDLVGDVFTAETDFGFTDTIKTPVYLNHRLPLETEDGQFVVLKAKIGEGTLTKDGNGVLIRAILYNRKMFKEALAAMGWSSGTAAHLVDREKRGKSRYVKTWPLGLDASLTPNPCDPDNVCSLKSYAESIKAVPITLSADDEAFFEPVDAEAKATWTTAYINDLPDSSFAYIEPGGEKKDGKTVPRSLRHFPYKDANGKPDEAHVRNALARIPQSNVSAEAKAKALAIIRRAAKALGIEVSSGKSQTFTEHFLSVVTAVEDHTKTATELVEDVTSLADRIRDRLEFRETKDGRTISAANRERLSATSANLAALIQAVQQMSAEINDLISMAEPKPKAEPVPLAEQVLTEAARFEALQFELANSHR